MRQARCSLVATTLIRYICKPEHRKRGSVNISVCNILYSATLGLFQKRTRRAQVLAAAVCELPGSPARCKDVDRLQLRWVQAIGNGLHRGLVVRYVVCVPEDPEICAV